MSKSSIWSLIACGSLLINTIAFSQYGKHAERERIAAQEVWEEAERLVKERENGAREATE